MTVSVLRKNESYSMDSFVSGFFVSGQVYFVGEFQSEPSLQYSSLEEALYVAYVFFSGWFVLKEVFRKWT